MSSDWTYCVNWAYRAGKLQCGHTHQSSFTMWRPWERWQNNYTREIKTACARVCACDSRGPHTHPMWEQASNNARDQRHLATDKLWAVSKSKASEWNLQAKADIPGGKWEKAKKMWAKVTYYSEAQHQTRRTKADQSAKAKQQAKEHKRNESNLASEGHPTCENKKKGSMWEGSGKKIMQVNSNSRVKVTGSESRLARESWKVQIST